MKMTKQKFERPVTGVGVVKMGRNSFSTDVEYFNKENGRTENEKFSFKADALPDDLPEGFELENGKSYFFNIRADGSAINSLRPAKGKYTVRCIGFAKNDDGEFVVIEKKGDFGKYKQIVANLQVLEGKHAGFIFPQYLPFGNEDKKVSGLYQYRFINDGEGNFTVVGNPDKSKNVAALFEFIEYTGLTTVEIPFPDDEEVDEQEILTVLDKAIRKLKKSMFLLVERGYPKSLGSLDDDEVEDVSDEEDDKVEEEVAVKAPVKKAKAVVVEDEEDDEPVVKAPAKKLGLSSKSSKLAKLEDEEEDD